LTALITGVDLAQLHQQVAPLPVDAVDPLD
jgi:hypothetical protein